MSSPSELKCISSATSQPVKYPIQSSTMLSGVDAVQASSKLELDLNSQLSRAKQSYPVISKKFLSVRPSVRPSVRHAQKSNLTKYGAKHQTVQNR
eukprot:scaffold12258_cov158-Skeletonema_menzelii.AAC.1